MHARWFRYGSLAVTALRTLFFSTVVGCGTNVSPIVDAGADGSVSARDASAADASSDGGATLDCASLAQRTCARTQSCTPLGFERTFESMPLCVASLTRDCVLNSNSSLRAANAVVDPAACQAALDSCPTYLANWRTTNGPLLPAACVPRRGTRSSAQSGAGRSCGTDSMCVTGEYCFDATQDPVCQDGTCSAPARLMADLDTCNVAWRDPCDIDRNQRCTRGFDPTQSSGVSIGANYTCRQVTFGGVGAGCSATTSAQCMPGLLCSRRLTCQPPLGQDMACDDTDDLCDGRLALTCRATPNSATKTCRPAPFARIGERCGSVTEGGVTEIRRCAYAVAFCNSATPSVCEALATMGAPCRTGIDDHCQAPLACRNGTCQPPPAVMCR